MAHCKHLHRALNAYLLLREDASETGMYDKVIHLLDGALANALEQDYAPEHGPSFDELPEAEKVFEDSLGSLIAFMDTDNPAREPVIRWFDARGIQG